MKKISKHFIFTLLVSSTVICFNISQTRVYSQEVQEIKEESQSEILTQSITTEDIKIPVEDLKLLVKPLTIDELQVEANAWLVILKNKVREITFAEIVINKKNRSVDEGNYQEQESVNNLEQTPQSKEESTETAEILPENTETRDGIKRQLLSTVTELQAEQTGIIDRFQVILNECESKGGDVETYQKYIESVSSINFNIEDTEGLGIRFISWLNSEEGGIRLLINLGKFIGVAIVVSIVGYLLSGIVKKTLSQFDGVSNLLTDFLVVTIKRGGVVLGVLLGLAVAGLNLGPLLALVGGISFILAFALQNNLGNFASGLMLMINKPFDIGDEVKIAGYWSFIDSIDLANTRLRKFDGSIVTLPNNSVWGGEIQNFTMSEKRKIVVYIYIKFEQDLNEVYDMWIELASSHPKVLKDPAPYWFPWNEHYESYICVGLNCWTNTDEYWSIYVDLLKQLQIKVKELNIQLTAPIQDIRLDDFSAKQNGLQIDKKLKSIK